MQNLTRKFFISAFLWLLMTPFLALLLGFHGFLSVSENRNFPNFPPISEVFKKNYFSRFDSYFSDHFGFRSELLWLGSMQAKLLNSSASQKVLPGKNGWLFLRSERNLDDYRNTEPLNASEVSAWVSYIRDQESHAKAIGAKFVFLLAPNSHTIYGEYYLPDWVAKRGAISRSDQIVEALKSEGLSIVDPRPLFFSKRDSELLYHRTDSHWSPTGAYYAYSLLMKTLNISSRTLSDYTPETRVAMQMDLTRLLGTFPIREEYTALVPHGGHPSHLVTPPEKTENAIYECPTCPERRAVVYRDSFMSAVIPYLNEHFRFIRYRWGRDLNWEEIAADKPQFVIQEVVERRLFEWVPPAK